MRHIVHHEQYNVALLVKDSAFNQDQIEDYYLKGSSLKVVSFTLDYAGKKKPSATDKMEYLNELLPILDERGIHDIIVADGEYFKTMAKVQKAEPHYGYVVPCKLKGFEHMNLCLSANYQAAIFNPIINDKIKLSIRTMETYKEGQYLEIGADIIHSAKYPDDYLSIQHMLNELHKQPCITADIEAFSLKHYSAGIGTIGFAWDKHNGFAFCVDYKEVEPYELDVWCKKDKRYKTKTAVATVEHNEPVRNLLREFFETYQGKIIWHNASFDCYVLVYQLWMNDLLDQKGLLKGLEVMHSSMECTKLITYLATNSTAGNKLSLKDQAHEFAGNYAESEINNILLIPKAQLLKYNLVDCLATWYVMDKHYDTMVLDNQLEVYEGLFKPAVKDIIQMQLTGMCLDMNEVYNAEAYMQGIYDTNLAELLKLPVIEAVTDRLRHEKMAKDNLTLKAKRRTIDDECIQRITFNPNSGKHVQQLLYEELHLPVLDYTKSKQPATGKKTLKKLSKLTTDETVIEVLNYLIQLSDVAKVLTAFIPVMKEAPMASDGMHYLFGSFNLGGTVSGRLSSNNPNMQNLPSGSTYAKYIKRCFVAAKGYLFAGADFNALEDRINTLLTRDPNKEKVLIDGFDGHSFRTYHFWKEKFPHINPDDPDSINTIQTDYDADRSRSKPVHFAMQYQGTWITLVRNCGFPESEARQIEANYQNLYKVSFDWVKEQIDKGSRNGYVTAAFGLRIRTPALAKTILGTRVTPYQAEAEARTVGNAVSGQSYGLLNTYASVRFMERVRASKYKYDIKPVAHIHDAIYISIKDDLAVIEWANKNLAECMRWQELPELKHDRITLPAELDLFYPNWATPVTLKNDLTQDQIITTIQAEVLKRNKK